MKRKYFHVLSDYFSSTRKRSLKFSKNITEKNLARYIDRSGTNVSNRKWLFTFEERNHMSPLFWLEQERQYILSRWMASPQVHCTSSQFMVTWPITCRRTTHTYMMTHCSATTSINNYLFTIKEPKVVLFQFLVNLAEWFTDQTIFLKSNKIYNG